MKKFLVFATLLLVNFFVSCTKETIQEEALLPEPLAENLGQTRNCAAQEVYEQQLAADPVFAIRRAEIESFLEEYAKTVQLRSGSLVTIPVHFNVLYKTAAQNISIAQLQSQIDVLNADFGAMNADYNNTPSLFQGVRSGDIGVAFSWDSSSGLTRKSTNKTSWQANDSMKKASQGGINPTTPTTKLNIWVCNLSGGILGYAQFPGGNSATDGVVLDDNATGSTGTAQSPYGLGRTATHEVGHWLNLRHIWGDATCGTDLVSDTPVHNASNGGCPAYPHNSTCSGNPVEMTMNYMDYTYDACMYMFSVGQKTRMVATFASGGGRNSFCNPCN
jgi:Pregnancy-associated plasma protein-A